LGKAKIAKDWSSIFKAESFLLITWYRQNGVMLALQVLWPYLTVVMLIALGTTYGSMQNFAKALGVRDPLLYILFSSFVVFTSAGIVDSAAQALIWHRWLGTLPYIEVSVPDTKLYVLMSSMAQTVVITSISLLALLRGALVMTGLRGLIDVMIVEVFVVLGSLPLLSLASLVAILSIMVKEESNVFSFLNPFLLMVSGVFYPVEILPRVLSYISKAVPVTYVVEAMRFLSTSSTPLGKGLMTVAATLAVLSLMYNLALLPALARGERALKMRGPG